MKIVNRDSWSLEIIVREIAFIEIIFIAMGMIVMKISMDMFCQNHRHRYHQETITK